MKKSLLALSVISAVTCMSVAHAETSALVATQPAAVAKDIATKTIEAVKTPPVPEMPKMPDMPKPPVPPTTIMHHIDDSGMRPHGMAMKAAEDATPATKAFIETNTKMHQGMMIDYSKNADVDFVKGMIPHHQGAVDMAKIVLEHGKDPEIKKFAQDIIKAQSTEIEFMNTWLKKHPK